MSSSVFFGQIVGFLNNGDVRKSYQDAMCSEKNIEMKPDDFEILLEAVFNIPPVLTKLEKKSTPGIMITTCKTETQKKMAGMKEWASFRNQNCLTRRLVNSLEEVMNEGPEEEAAALQKTLERSGVEEFDDSSKNCWGEEPLYALQHGLTGLYDYPHSDIWRPQSSEMDLAPYDFSDSSSCNSADSTYDSLVSDFVNAAVFY